MQQKYFRSFSNEIKEVKSPHQNNINIFTSQGFSKRHQRDNPRDNLLHCPGNTAYPTLNIWKTQKDM